MNDQDISHAAWQVGQAATQLADHIATYHATWASTLKPRLFKDGDMWCALYGEGLQVGIAGFGPNPALALMAFETAMYTETGAHNIARRTPTTPHKD